MNAGTERDVVLYLFNVMQLVVHMPLWSSNTLIQCDYIFSVNKLRACFSHNSKLALIIPYRRPAQVGSRRGQYVERISSIGSNIVCSNQGSMGRGNNRMVFWIRLFKNENLELVWIKIVLKALLRSMYTQLTLKYNVISFTFYLKRRRFSNHSSLVFKFWNQTGLTCHRKSLEVPHVVQACHIGKFIYLDKFT
jgi:hypothetical protein